MYNICFEFGLNQRFQVYLTKHLQEAIYQIDETTLMISGPEEKETKEHQDCIYNSCELSNCDYLFKLCEAIFAGINLIIWQFHFTYPFIYKTANPHLFIISFMVAEYVSACEVSKFKVLHFHQF